MSILRSPRGRRAFTLVEVLIVMVIIIALMAILMPHYLGGKTIDGKTVASPRARAQATVCMEYLRQVRMAVQMAHDNDTDGKYPASLDELKLPAEVTHCDVGHEPYLYDPQTGQVHCPHPGHESF